MNDLKKEDFTEMSMELVDWDHIRVMFHVRLVVFQCEILRFQREELESREEENIHDEVESNRMRTCRANDLLSLARN